MRGYKGGERQKLRELRKAMREADEVLRAWVCRSVGDRPMPAALLSYEVRIRLCSDQRLSPALARKTLPVAVDALLTEHGTAY